MFNVSGVTSRWRALAVAIGAAVAVTLMTTSAYAQPAAARAAAASSLLPMSTSWPAPQRGIVLSYPSRTAGARPSLFMTSNGGRSWRQLPAPPLAFPADNDTPDATWAGGVIAVTDGTRIVATRDDGRRWSAVTLAGAPDSGSVFVGHITIADGRLYTLVTTSTSGSGGQTAAVYAGPAHAPRLRAVRGLSVSGGITYGDITAVGGLQVSLGSDFATERYWRSGNGLRFVSSPLPCPVTARALLGGTRGGHPVALCSGSPSDVGPGEDDHQVWTAPRPGGQFAASGPVFVFGNEQAFAAASAQDMTLAAAGGLGVSHDGGMTWTTELTQPNGASWQDLAFPSSTVGVVVSNTVSDQLQQVGTVFRTTDAGRTWSALTLP